MSGGFNQASNNTPKPPQIGGGNYNPYKGTQSGAANSASVKKAKDVSPLAAYERDHNQQRIFSTYIDPPNDQTRQPAVYQPQQQPTIPNKNTSHLAANAVKANSRYAPPLQVPTHHAQQQKQHQSPRNQAGLNFQKNNAVLYPAQLSTQSNGLTLNNGAGGGSALEDLNTQAQSPQSTQKRARRYPKMFTKRAQAS